MSNLNFSSGSGDKKLTDFMSGRGVYLLLAICLVGSGVAAWSAISGSFFTEGEQQPQISSPPSSDWEFPILERAETNDPDQPLPSSQSPALSQQQPELSEQDESTEVLEQQPEQPISVFVLPLEGEVLAPYSAGELVKNVTLGEWRTHNGVDIKGDAGSEVVAITSGVVKAVKDDPIWGFTVEIDHGNGLTAIYCGLSSDIRISRGESVKTRQVIGFLDAVPAESSLPTHLHFEVKLNGKYVDPFEALGKS